jgi:hypothetical protein
MKEVRTISNDWIKIIQQQAEFSKKFATQFEIAARVAENAGSIIIQNLEVFSSRMKSIVIPHIDTTQLTESLKNIGKGLLETESDIKVFKAAMVEMGYPPHDGMSIRQMRTIAKHYKTDSDELKENIDGFMSALYNPNEMKLILLSWEKKKLIRRRLPLLRNAIMAHNLGMYDLVVPSVLSQLEGVLVDIFTIKGNVNGQIQEIMLQNLLLKNYGYERSFSFDDSIHDYYVKNILVNFEHGKTAKSDLSRHAILHGSDTDFGKQTTSLKVLLLFDYFVTASENIKDEDIQKTKREVAEIRKRNRYRK